MKKIIFFAVFLSVGYTLYKFVTNNFNVKKTIESLKNVWTKAPDVYDVNSIAWDSEYKEPSYFVRSAADIYTLNAKNDKTKYDSFVQDALDTFHSVNASGNAEYYRWLAGRKDAENVQKFNDLNENWTYSDLGKALGLIP